MRQGEALLHVAGTDFIASVEGALVWPEESLLAIADLHLEKGSSFAERRVLLPPYDTAATLARLARLIQRFAPRRLVLLGDSFHDRRASGRIAPGDREALIHLLARREVFWIAGNHDPDPPEALPGDAADCLALGPVLFRHEPRAGAAAGEVAGHLHPVARVAARGRALRRRCFAGDGSRAVLPAFGAYAGGLNVRDVAFAPLFPKGFTAHLMGDERVFAFPRARCIGD
ncbi:ligase-associated DNA damage response endonuclease PdeM [Labrys wisconsinensis]|uniref:DNA ligase-associated metallophosphoesterase n=1 Tax=Labrys wisconsinensis TaxID=425677 RepID=A0ABU0JFH9_9HYPH|nr:ligase-associated DNA damage response endonuclease PdeM [Labrys wisconsinensis]MDQ0472350.1 DNA ligase-associated metallophosphoesterase [Labrys wisconsinensis]